jgi:CRISPR-associated protein Cmr6
MRYPLPRASVQAFHARNQGQPQNPGLIFDRFAPDWSEQATLKKDGLEAVRKAAEKADAALLRDWNIRWETLARTANAEPFSLKTDWRFIAGLGRKGALEVGFTFHRYGFPILLGSSVKGVARAWALIQIAEKAGQSDLKVLDEQLSIDGEKDSRERKQYETWRNSLPQEVRRWVEDCRAIFGTTAAAGRAIFFDAIPIKKPTLELDIMNPHYPQYYSGQEFPTDWQSPVPIYFLTVAPGTEFRFAVGWRGPWDDNARRFRKLAEQWLVQGVTELGAGAKTSAGYGYFTDFRRADEEAPGLVTGAQPLSEETPGSAFDPQQQFVDDFVQGLQALPAKDVAGQIARFVDQWRQSQLPDEFRLQMAQAILDKVEAAKRTKKSQTKKWFQELQAFVIEHRADEK